jgi:hypothetical protein
MRALRIARWSLLWSLLLWAASAALGASGTMPGDAALLAMLVSIPAIAISAAACVVIQLALLLRRPRA